MFTVVILLFITVIWKLEKKKLKKKVENGTLKFWKPWIWRKTFWLFFSAHIAQERFWNWLEFIHTSEFEIQQLQNICWQLWFQNSKKSAEMKCFFLEILDKKVLRIRSRLDSFCLLPLWSLVGNDLWFLSLEFSCVY